MSEQIPATGDREAAMAGLVDKGEIELNPVASQMKAVLDAIEDADEIVVTKKEVFDDLLPDENGQPYIGQQRWSRIGAGARTDTEAFLDFIPSYVDVSLSQPNDEKVRERYAGGTITMQHRLESKEIISLSVYVRNNKVLGKELVNTRPGSQDSLELNDDEALEMLHRGMTIIANELIDVAARVRDETKAERAMKVVQGLVRRAVVSVGDFDEATWRTLIELYGENN